MKNFLLCIAMVSVMGYATDQRSCAEINVFSNSTRLILQGAEETRVPGGQAFQRLALHQALMTRGRDAAAAATVNQGPNRIWPENHYNRAYSKLSDLPRLSGLVAEAELSLLAFVRMHMCQVGKGWRVDVEEKLRDSFIEIKNLDRELMHVSESLGGWRMLTHGVPGDFNLEYGMLHNRAAYVHSQIEDISAAVERFYKEKAVRRAQKEQQRVMPATSRVSAASASFPSQAVSRRLDSGALNSRCRVSVCVEQQPATVSAVTLPNVFRISGGNALGSKSAVPVVQVTPTVLPSVFGDGVLENTIFVSRVQERGQDGIDPLVRSPTRRGSQVALGQRKKKDDIKG